MSAKRKKVEQKNAKEAKLQRVVITITSDLVGGDEAQVNIDMDPPAQDTMNPALQAMMLAMKAIANSSAGGEE